MAGKSSVHQRDQQPVIGQTDTDAQTDVWTDRDR